MRPFVTAHVKGNGSTSGRYICAMQTPVLGIVSTWFERGATHVSLAYIQALDAHFDIRVYARSGDEFPHSDPKWNKDFVHWGEFVPGAPKTFIDWSDFSKWMSREKVDILLFNEQQSWDVILRLKELKDRPLIGAYIDYYTDDTTPFFELYDFLLCNTERHYSVFKEHPGAIYIPWGVDLKLYPTKRRPERPFTFFHSLGYNPERKGTDLLVSAFSNIENPNVRLLLHAQRPLNDFNHLQDIIEKDDRIRWINEEVGPPGLYNLGDVYVYPSRLDGIGLSLPEALASGLPSIVPNEAPMNEFVEDGKNGWLVEVAKRWKREDSYYWEMCECDVVDLQRKMEAAIQADRSSMRENTLEHARQNLDWNKNASKLNEALLQVKKHTASSELMVQCRQWETAHTPSVTFKQKVHRILIRLGARAVKRRIFGRK